MALETEIHDIVVPHLEDLYETGIMDYIKHLFNSSKDEYYKLYPVLSKYDEKMIPIYIIYVIISNYYLDGNSTSLDEYVDSLIDTKVLDNEFCKGVTELFYLLTDYETEEENYKIVYEGYKDNFVKSLEKKQEVIDFQKTLKINGVEKAVRNYLLSTSGVNVEKLGVDMTFEETIDYGVYIFYQNLYLYFTCYCDNPVNKMYYKNKIKKLDQESLNNLVKVYLISFDQDIYTYDEFLYYLSKRKQFATNILTLSADELIRYNEIVRTKGNIE